MYNLSIVIPVYNEEANVLKLASEISEVFRHVDFKWEVIWVDDCSTDQTLQQLKAIELINPKHKILSLPKACGQSAAVLNGIRRAKYDLIGTLDGDGQNAPLDLISLKRLVEDTGIYLAQGVRIDRKDANLRLLSTNVANSFRRFVMDDNLSDVGCAVRVFHKEIAQLLPAFKGWHRFLPVIIMSIYPDKILEHPVSHRERHAGVSKYGVWNRLWVGLYDLIGMKWFKSRMVKIYLNEEIQWEIMPILLVSQDRFFSQVELQSSGLRVSEQMNQ